MTEPDPDFDATHPSGHVLFRSCRGGYLHSVALSEGAMYTDAETLARAITLTADVSYLRAAMQVRAEILAAGHTPSAEVPSPPIWPRRSTGYASTGCMTRTRRPEPVSVNPALHGISGRGDLGGRFDGVFTEECPGAGQHQADLVELLLQRRFGHVPKTTPRVMPTQFTLGASLPR